MSDAVLRILNNPEFSAGLVVEAKKKIEARYTLAHMADATIAVYKELMHSTKILIIKMTAVGDVVLSTAAFKAIRYKFPNAQIYCLTSPAGQRHCGELVRISMKSLCFDPAIKNFKALWQRARNCAAIILIKWWICKITA